MNLLEIIAARKAELAKQEGEALLASPVSVSVSVPQKEENKKEKEEKPVPFLKRTLAEILAERKTQLQKEIPPKQEKKEEDFRFQISEDAVEIPSLTKEESISISSKKTFSLDIKLNEKQEMAKNLAFAGRSFCLIGAAGTGKTTAQREVARSLLASSALGTHNFKVQGMGERWIGPSIAFVAFTRIASGNLKRAIHKVPELEEALLHNVTTIHNLLEFEPEFYYDEETEKEKMRFVPKRTAMNPLTITHLVIEEASMVDIPLWEKLWAALPTGVQIIFIGDINQLPPVFGPSILNYALKTLPVIELTEVYRQSEDSTILENAHKILKGQYPLTEAPDFSIVRMGDIQHTEFKTALKLSKMFRKLKVAGEYDPEQDIILSPFNVKDCGTLSLNNHIAQYLGEEREAVVHEVITGISKCYLAEGDKVLYNKQVGVITKIVCNGDYRGKAYLPASKTLTRFGVYSDKVEDDEDFELAGYENIDLDAMLNEKEDKDTVRQASHVVTLLMETGLEVTLRAVGDFHPSIFTLGYALTIHKAQGCEWRTVFLVLHKNHSVMAFRELLYTAVTRSRERCVIFAKDFMVKKCIDTQRIKGNSLEEKIEIFNSGLMTIKDVRILK